MDFDADDQTFPYLPLQDAAYRIFIPREKLEHDPELKKMVDEPIGLRWMGRRCPSFLSTSSHSDCSNGRTLFDRCLTVDPFFYFIFIFIFPLLSAGGHIMAYPIKAYKVLTRP